MKYITANKEKATQVGVAVGLHRIEDGLVVLNEKEVMLLPMEQKTLDDRAKQLGGKVFCNAEELNVYFVNYKKGEV